MNNKKRFKLILDVVMLVLLVMVFKKNLISMQFHEIGGLVLIALFLLHNVLNGKWIKAVFGRFFDKGLGSGVIASAIVDVFSVITFLLVGISGVLISKTIFSFNVGGAWKTIHYFCAALSIIFMGVHIGLHWNFIKKSVIGPNINRALKVAGIILTTCLVVLGSYNVGTSSFSKWISMPFTVNGIEGADGKNNNQSEETKEIRGDKPNKSNEMRQNGGEGQHGGSMSISSIFLTMLNYFSMIVLFATATALIAKIIRGKSQYSLELK